MNWYTAIVHDYPFTSAMVQFAILGTLGDCIARWLRARRFVVPFPPKEFIWKFIEWAFLAILIKVAFVGFAGFVDTLLDYDILPAVFETGFLNAFAISVTMNLQFGILLVLLHRILDGLPFGKINWANISGGLYSLLWFWIPAHTVTFMLPQQYRIGLAALWSVMLGLILGWFNKVDTTSR